MAIGDNLKTKNEKPSKESEALVDVEKNDAYEIESQEEKVSSAQLHQYCVFRSGPELYCIPIDIVKEVVVSPPSTMVPQLPTYITGMVNVRGNIYGILDLNEFLNEDAKEEENPYLLLLDHDEYQMGISIPTVPDTIMVDESEIEDLPTSRLKSATGQKFLKGIIKKDDKMIVIFDILNMLSWGGFTEVN